MLSRRQWFYPSYVAPPGPPVLAFVPYVLTLSPRYHSALGLKDGSNRFFDDVSGSYTSAIPEQPTILQTTNEVGQALTNVSAATGGGPIAGRGRTVVNTGYPALVAGRNYPIQVQGLSGSAPNGFALALAFKPSSAATGSSHLASWNVYYANSVMNFPCALWHFGATDALSLQLSYGNDFTADVVITTPNGSCPKNQWNYVVFRIDPYSGPAAPVAVYLNGAKYSGSRSGGFGTPGGFWLALGSCASYYSGGTTNPIQFYGEMAELSLWDQANLGNITDETAANLNTKFLAGI